ncbi:MAG TPA: helix-turn-helix domain-containing protein [Cytophagaceae bacterium]|jgi:DNA-binding HxlR family transcriptional regulator|nr:helix-turn-helix domain-containing protein [Cytophagaceae bacterium]
MIVLEQAQVRTEEKDCPKRILPIRDTLDVLSGKWKLPIIGSLFFGKKRFKELERDIPKITPRMLSKELRELEINQLVSRRVYDTIPATVEYEITEYGKTLSNVLDAMMDWGTIHRKRIIGEK